MSRIPSPARSEEAPIMPRLSKLRRTLSVASASSDASGRLTSMVEQVIQNHKLQLSPMRRRSVLPDDTNIEMPRRASWWKRLEGSSRDVLEALDVNKMVDNVSYEDFEIEVQKKTQNQSVQESSDNESIASIVVPPTRLFSQKKQSQGKFGDNMGSRISLVRTNLEDHDNTINVMPKNLFKQGQPINRPVFPAALLNSTNKTINQTVEPETNKQGRQLFGQARTKRKKNMFTDFVLSESEDDSEVQYQVFGFKNNDNKRISLASRNKRMPSLTPSVTTEIDIDDWNLLPSSTMIGNGSGAMEVSKIKRDEDTKQVQEENADVTLTEACETLNPESNEKNKSKTKEKQSLNCTRLSRNQSDELMIKLNAEVIDIVQVSKTHDVDEIIELNDVNNTPRSNKTLRSEVCIGKTMDTESQKSFDRAEIVQKKQDITILQHDIAGVAKSGHNVSGNEIVLECSKLASNAHEVINENDAFDEAPDNGNINEQTTKNEPSVEDKMAKLYGDSEDIEDSEQKGDLSLEHESKISTKESSNEDQDEDMKEMTWDENDDDKAFDTTKENDDDQNREDNEHDMDDQNDENGEKEVSKHATLIEDIPDKSQKIVESSVKSVNMGQENDVADESPNSTYDTTGRNRKKSVTQVNSPEAVLKNMSKENMSFKPIGRSTSFRKSMSLTEDINTRRTLIPVEESIIGSEGSRNSSSEGSGWDSHRVTRKTLRQTFGKDFTPRKSLRALVMAKSAKRQTDGGRDSSKINKMVNKQNKTTLEDQRIRDRPVPIHNLSSEQLCNPKSPALEIAAHHVPDSLIAKPQISYCKSVSENNELGISRKILNREASNQVLSDSGPEISMNASYGTGMSRESFGNASEDHFKTSEQSVIKKCFVRIETEHEMHEELDYDPSVQEDFIRELSSRNMSEHEQEAQESEQEEGHKDNQPEKEGESDQENELQETQQKIEAVSEQEKQNEKARHEIKANTQEIEAESDQDEEHEETQQATEAESEQEETQQEIEAESEQEEEYEETQREIEAESEQKEEQEESQREIEAESEQEEEHEKTQQELEVESEHEVTEQETVVESDEEQQDIETEVLEKQSRELNKSQESVNVSEHESGQDTEHIYNEPDTEFDSNYEQDDEEDSQNNISKRFTKCVVFDNEMSDQEIDYEQSERQITDIENSEQVSDDEIIEGNMSRVSVQNKGHDVSIGTQKSLLVKQMRKMTQEKVERRQKIRADIQNWLRQKRLAYNQMSPMQSKYSSIRRIKNLEAKHPKTKPRTNTAFEIKELPKEFLEDLKYKPPKRFQPANAPWITKRLYKYLETKLEPRYDYRARVRAEQLVQKIFEFTKQVRRRDLAPQNTVDELKQEMARLNVVHTHFEFHEFFHEFMPREIRIKVNPDIVNKIPLPRNGIFGDILQSRPVTD